jgi:hypothetical protein
MQLTARQAYIDILTELKEEAPTLYLEVTLLFNKAISEYMKTRYEVFETNQQLADDMRSWKKSFQASSLEFSSIYVYRAQEDRRIQTPLSCIIDVAISRPINQMRPTSGTTTSYKVTRMSSEIKAGLLGNKYLEAKFYRPYFLRS